VAAGRCACVNHPSRDRTISGAAMTSYSFCHTARVCSKTDEMKRHAATSHYGVPSGRSSISNDDDLEKGNHCVLLTDDPRRHSSIERQRQPEFSKTILRLHDSARARPNFFCPSLDRS